ncbi:MAG: glycosyltransferase family 2 protein [Acidobacteria bacterium]|nr:glycosyltransferase family 2 protein [Acidobacteriota bacterium]
MPEPRPTDPRLLIIVPAYNEEAAIGHVVRSVRYWNPQAPVLVIDDCSTDATVRLAREAGAELLLLPHHLGLGGCVQAGYKLAFERGYDYVIRVDGDGQHEAGDIPRILEALERSGCDMVIGSRYLASRHNNHYSSLPRRIGIWGFRKMLRLLLGKPVHDPTSGFVGVNRRALEVFSRSFPLAYPEIEALVVLQRKAFRFVEIPCKSGRRMGGRSSITPLKSLSYLVHVLLGVFVNILRYDGRSRRRWSRRKGD